LLGSTKIRQNGISSQKIIIISVEMFIIADTHPEILTLSQSRILTRWNNSISIIIPIEKRMAKWIQLRVPYDNNTFLHQPDGTSCENLIWKIQRMAGGGKEMSETDEPTVAKVIELIGSSQKGWDDAAANAVKEAAKTVRNIKGVYLKECTAKVEDNRIVEYRSIVKISFLVELES
jgi:flavin-binding protein dodecin